MARQRGTQWSRLAKFFPGRTDVSLKNRWNKLQRRSKKLGVSGNGAVNAEAGDGSPEEVNKA
jgi:hypothetical protein